MAARVHRPTLEGGVTWTSTGSSRTSKPNGTPLKPDSISGTVSRMCRDLGLPKGASLHTVRHSHASLLLEKGVDLATVRERLGHSSIATTAKIYSHALRGKDFAAAQIWDDIKEQARAGKTAGVS